MAARKKRANSSQTSLNHRSKKPKFCLDNQVISLDRGGNILVAGQNDVGQLGLGDEVQEKLRLALLSLEQGDIVDISAGGMHTVCLTKLGQVYTFGCNDDGALGRPTEDENDEYSPGLVKLPRKVNQISAGDSHTAALLEGGQVYIWGSFRDSHGNMGLITPQKSEKLPSQIKLDEDIPIVKIASGENHLVLLTENGTVYTCGNGEQGQLGRCSERTSVRNANSEIFLKATLIHLKFRKINFDDIFASNCGSFCKVAGSEEVYVFGLNNYGQLGIKHQGVQHFAVKSKVFSSNNFKLKSICGGIHHTLALDTEGRCYAIGRHDYGRLGLGENAKDATELEEIPALKGKNVVQIAAGLCCSFAVTDKGELFSWGMGTSGQLASGSTDDILEPTLVKGKQLENKSVIKVSSGGQHTVALVVNEE